MIIADIHKVFRSWGVMDEIGWDEMRWDGIRWDGMRCDGMRWLIDLGAHELTCLRSGELNGEFGVKSLVGWDLKPKIQIDLHRSCSLISISLYVIPSSPVISVPSSLSISSKTSSICHFQIDDAFDDAPVVRLDGYSERRAGRPFGYRKAAAAATAAPRCPSLVFLDVFFLCPRFSAAARFCFHRRLFFSSIFFDDVFFYRFFFIARNCQNENAVPRRRHCDRGARARKPGRYCADKHMSQSDHVLKRSGRVRKAGPLCRRLLTGPAS